MSTSRAERKQRDCETVTEPQRFSASAWSGVPLGPKDPIFGLQEAFLVDTDSRKLNVSLGAYRDDDGNPFVLPVVRKVEQTLVSSGANMEYAPIIGLGKFIKCSLDLAYGANSDAIKNSRVAGMQTISGTGALRIAFAFLAKYLPDADKQVYVPDPTYANHFPILEASGFGTTSYRYYHADTNGLDLDGMLEDLGRAKEGSIVMLHAVAHNPTGVDPKPEQWERISKVCKDRRHVIVFDCAYQGFASGETVRDVLAVRQFVEDGHQVLLCQSMAKNFGLYGHRVGCFSLVTESSEERVRVESQLKILARAMYSNPPIHGARIVAEVLGSPELNKQWRDEVKIMSQRIIDMRHLLRDSLRESGSTRNWDYITDQIGMFCYTGLSPDQVDKMIEEWHIYMTRNGRISMAGVNTSNAAYIAEALHAVTK